MKDIKTLFVVNNASLGRARIEDADGPTPLLAM